MSEYDRTKWNAKYQTLGGKLPEPSSLITSIGELLPQSGSALDIAGGTGRHAIWLAHRGLDVTLADISENGLQIAEGHAAESGVSMKTVQVDFEMDRFPAGPWDLILSVCYLWRPLFQVFPRVLRPNGMLVVVQPTRKNLERHEKPPAGFLLADGELPSLVTNLEIVRYEEGWLADGRHDALLVAQRPTLSSPSTCADATR